MTHSLLLETPASAYDRLAPHYDAFTAGYDHDRWVAELEARAQALGQCGYRALDLACGTGRSTAPLLRRDYSVLACDISPEMIRIARAKFPAHSDSFIVADMRELANVGEFDLVLCLDDAVNHLLADEDLAKMFRSVASLLAPDGMFVFDVNSLRTYRTAFADVIVRDTEAAFFSWAGQGRAEYESGETVAATIEVFASRPDGLWERSSSRHVQRHHPEPVIRGLLSEAGLECCSSVGQSPGIKLDPVVDESRHTKVVYFARHAARPSAPWDSGVYGGRSDPGAATGSQATHPRG
jgi:SAM-dependent methyltransferase